MLQHIMLQHISISVHREGRMINMRQNHLLSIYRSGIMSTGFPFFGPVAVTANGYWYYTSALKSTMRAKLCLCYRFVNIALNYVQ